MRDVMVKIDGVLTDTTNWSSRCRNYKHQKCTNRNGKCTCPHHKKRKKR